MAPQQTPKPIHKRKKKKLLEQENKTYNFWEESLSVASFNMDLENLAQEDPQKAADALEIMEHMYQQEPDNDYYVKPTTACYTTIINHFEAEQAQEWLDRLEDRYDATGDPDLKPNAVTYMLVCQKYANDYSRDFSGESAEKAEGILQRMRERLKDAPHFEYDDIKVRSIVLEAWCKRAGKIRGAIHKAEQILTEIEQKYLEQQKQAEHQKENAPNDQGDVVTSRKGAAIRPNIVMYTNFIGALARSKEHNTAEKAEEILERMTTISGIEPDMVTYTALCNCYSKSSSYKERSKAAKRAMEILQYMETQYSKEEKYYLKPSVISYGTAIKAISNSFDPYSADLAEKVLRRMYSLHESGTITNVKPQTSTFNAVISALAAHSRRNRQKYQTSHNVGLRAKAASVGLANARRAEKLIVEMTKKAREGEEDVTPNVRTWGAVLSAWAESGLPDAGKQCLRVLERMEQLRQKGESAIRPNYVCRTTAIAAIGHSAVPGTTDVAIAKNKAAADQVEALLIKMELDYEKTMDPDERPNTITYTCAIEAFCRLDEANAAERSQTMIGRMLRLYAKGLGHVRPSRIVFNSLINAWSRSPSKGAAKKAEEVFKWMEQQYRELNDNIVRPDEVSLCGVLNAWANNAQNGGARRAQQILDHMESMPPKERGFQHSTICHNIVVKAWARSKEPDAVQKAEIILLHLEEMAEAGGEDCLKPDVTTYSSVINCCAYYVGAFGIQDKPNEDMDTSSKTAIRGREEAFKVAMRTFRKMYASKTAKPNNVAFGTIFKVRN